MEKLTQQSAARRELNVTHNGKLVFQLAASTIASVFSGASHVLDDFNCKQRPFKNQLVTSKSNPSMSGNNRRNSLYGDHYFYLSSCLSSSLETSISLSEIIFPSYLMAIALLVCKLLALFSFFGDGISPGSRHLIYSVVVALTAVENIFLFIQYLRLWIICAVKENSPRIHSLERHFFYLKMFLQIAALSSMRMVLPYMFSKPPMNPAAGTTEKPYEQQL
ncbi:predicted protein [Coccidioides posadasii str. Silveira]|uniref:Predicted protein n=1 Tax=Coccidioides posadasii (strain RMSCC 757 / Silveira) TaxID=443226 RepID=E9DGF1_COCPS|nr:predicted protein [Coccidioides posadasii str. Silveira]